MKDFSECLMEHSIPRSERTLLMNTKKKKVTDTRKKRKGIEWHSIPKSEHTTFMDTKTGKSVP